MIIRKPSDLPYSQVTPKQVYVNRRRFLGGLALGAAQVPQISEVSPLLYLQ